MRLLADFLRSIAAQAILTLARVVTSPHAIWLTGPPARERCIYFANHTSHGDFVLIWAVLPPQVRSRTKPVAAAEYWQRGWLRRALSVDIFRAVLIDREHVTKNNDPIKKMTATLDEGSSLIVFPEGTRNLGSEGLLPFKGGLYNLAKARPDVELVPVWIDNLNRVLPKGEFLPVPLLCTVRFGGPLTLMQDERKTDFLERARMALLDAAPRKALP